MVDSSLANAPPDNTSLEAFIAKWQGREGDQERANYALFLTELCLAIGLPSPEPASASAEFNDYVSDRAVRGPSPDGGESARRIDLYKRGCFELEAKQSRQRGGKKEVATQPELFAEPAPRGARSANRAWDVLMLNARRQAEAYARALPVSDGWPPFILVCDVGHVIEVYWSAAPWRPQLRAATRGLNLVALCSAQEQQPSGSIYQTAQTIGATDVPRHPELTGVALVLPSEPLELAYYVTEAGDSPFETWFEGLNQPAAAKVVLAVDRPSRGNVSNVKSVGDGVLEYRISWGPGLPRVFRP